VKRICTQQIAGHSINRAAHAVPGVFEMVGGGPIRVDDGGRAGETMAALVSAGPSLGAGEAVAGRAARTPENPQQSRGPNAAFIEGGRTCPVNDGTARRMPGPGINFRPDGARLRNRPYTLWRADRLLICGRDAIVH
jgi:hypothetical protein